MAAYEVAQAQRGFRIGFLVPVGLVGAGLGMYLAAPALSTWLPAAEPMLTALISQGDIVQERLAAQIFAAFERLGAGGGS